MVNTDLVLINSNNYEPFFDMLTPSAQGDFHLQYLGKLKDEENKDFFAIGLAEDDTACGVIGLILESDLEAHITSLYVPHAYRRKGYGTELVIAAADFAFEVARRRRLVVKVAKGKNINNNLSEFFDFLEFDKEALTDIVGYHISLEKINENMVIKKASQQSDVNGIKYFSMLTRAEINSIANQGFLELSYMISHDLIDKEISTCIVSEKKSITGFVMIGKENEGALEVVWIQINSENSNMLPFLFAKSLKVANKKYPGDTIIKISCINNSSTELAKKLFGDDLEVFEEYTHYKLDFEKPYNEET